MEFAGSISASLRLGSIARFKKNAAAVAGCWQHCHPRFTGRDLNLTPVAPEINALPLDQLAGELLEGIRTRALITRVLEDTSSKKTIPNGHESYSTQALTITSSKLHEF